MRQLKQGLGASFVVHCTCQETYRVLCEQSCALTTIGKAPHFVRQVVQDARLQTRRLGFKVVSATFLRRTTSRRINVERLYKPVFVGVDVPQIDEVQRAEHFVTKRL